MVAHAEQGQGVVQRAKRNIYCGHESHESFRPLDPLCVTEFKGRA